MKTDTCTKIIMTVIAVALVKIAFQDTQGIKPLFAQNVANKCVTSSDLDRAVNDIKQHIESWSTSPKRLKLRR